MIKVLHVIEKMDRGGAETFIMNVFRSIDRTKVMFDFLVASVDPGAYDGEIYELGGEVFRVPLKQGKYLGRFFTDKERKRFFSQHPQYDAIHLHLSSLSNVSTLLAARSAGVKMRIIHSHSTREGGSLLHVIPHFLNRLRVSYLGTHFFACSLSAASWMYGNRVKSTDRKIIKNGIDCDRYVFSSQARAAIRAEFRIPETSTAVGSIARFSPVKNQKFLMDVFAYIINANAEAKLILAGDGPLYHELTEYAKSKGLQRDVIFTGARSDVNRILSALDVFALPSLYEGFPVSAVEAQASGLYCLLSEAVTREVKLTEKVEFLETGSRNAALWANAIMKHKSQERKSQEKEIREAGYCIEEVSEGLLAIYTEVSND